MLERPANCPVEVWARAPEDQKQFIVQHEAAWEAFAKGQPFVVDTTTTVDAESLYAEVMRLMERDPA